MLKQKRVLFLNSSAGIWAHTATDALLLNRLSARGAKVSTISCDGYLTSLCAVRRSRSRTLEDVKANPRIDCVDCKFTARITSTACNADHVERFWMNDFLTALDRREASEFVSAWQVSGCPEDGLFSEVPIARLAGYEVSLTYKSWDEATLGNGREEYHRAVEDAALTVLVAKRFFAKFGDFTELIVRSPHFANNGAFAHVAKQYGVRVIFIDGSPNISEDYTHLMLWDWGKFSSGNPAKKIFRFDQVELDESAKERITRHIKALQGGASHKVYSPAKGSVGSPLKALGADVLKPTALIALSSTDEAVSALKAGVNPTIKYPGVVFKDQHEWVQHTMDWFARRPHLQLVIRVHPREFPNRREGKTSQAGLLWEEQLSNLPSNIFLDHPNAKLSIYDLMSEIKVLITGWSSVGVEAALNGVPLVTYDANLPSYPADLGLTGTSAQEYFENLESALEQENDTPFEENALKWAHFLMNVGTSRVGGRFLAGDRALLARWINLFLEGVDRYFFFVYRPIDLWRGIRFEPTDWKFQAVVLDGKSHLYE